MTTGYPSYSGNYGFVGRSPWSEVDSRLMTMIPSGTDDRFSSSVFFTNL
jgi:hypothetical protein